MTGNQTLGPMKALDDKSLLEGGQRWRFVPIRSRLNNTSARPSALPALPFEANLEHVRPDDTNFSHFSATLASTAEVNLTATFTDYADKVKPLAISLPLVFRNRKKILSLTFSALQVSTENAAEATPAISNCLTALSKDLGPEHFHPFFPRLISEFAALLHKSKGHTSPSHPAGPKPHTQAMFWDPQVSMVPLFATLAEITKNHLQYLASDPDGTVRSLLPLLSSSHYRVREMTAESCLGYLLRKTRDSVALRRLTLSILAVLRDPLFPRLSTNAAVDGLGAALFEAVRLPSGRLHPRGGDVLSYALGRLCDDEMGGHQNTAKAEDFHDQMLTVVSRCMAGLSLYLKEATDVQAVFDTLLSALQDAQEQNDVRQAGDVAFLMRKLLQRGTRVLGALKNHRIQMVLNALSDNVRSFLDSPRFVFEGLGGLAAVVLNATESQLRHSSAKALCTALAKVARSVRSASLTAAMAVLLRLRLDCCTIGTAALMTEGYASLCEQLAKTSADGVGVESERKKSKTQLAFQAALLWVSQEAGHYSSGWCRRRFHAPTLERLCSEESVIRDLRQCTAYLSAVLLSHPGDVFENMLVKRMLSAADLALVLQALSFQFSGRREALTKALKQGAKVAACNCLDSLDTTSRQADILRALRLFAMSFPSLMREVLRMKGNSHREYQVALIQNLSSRDQAIRMESSELLSCLTECLCDYVGSKPIEYSRIERDDNRALQTMLGTLRRSLKGEDMNLVGFYRTLRHIMGIDPSLRRIEISLRLLQELGRLLRVGKGVNHTAVEASVHFSIGLLRTPLKLLWPAAAEIWAAATSLRQECGMSVIVNQLNIAGKELLQERFRRRGQELSDEEDRGSGNEEKSDGECDWGDSGSKDHVQESEASDTVDFAGSNAMASSGSKKRPRNASGSTGAETQETVSKRQRRRERNSLVQMWSSTEWTEFCDEHLEASVNKLKKLSNKILAGKASYCTDNFTLLRELLATLSKEPKYTVAFRRKIVESFLLLDPQSFSGRMGDSIAIRFTNLLDKMGGLKCSENDMKLELEMRNRLLSNLTRSSEALQIATIRCLCVSRCPSLRPHRESFIRLIEDSSFREELTVQTEALFMDWEESEHVHKLTAEKDLVIDVLVRICFSKMTGKRAQMDSRRSAVLSFVVAKLPAEIALPRITNLILSPIAHILDEKSLPATNSASSVVDRRLVPLKIQLGVLSSIEAVLKHCKNSFPPPCWERTMKGAFGLLKNARSGAAGQNLRSRCLRVLADMCAARPGETGDYILPVLETLRLANFDTSGQGDGQAAPALLHFVTSVFTADLDTVQKSVMKHEPWVLQWSLQFLESESANAQTVKLSLAITEQLVSLLDGLTSGGSESIVFQRESEELSFVLPLLGSSLRALLLRLVQDAASNRARQKTWGAAFECSLALAERLIRTDLLKADVLLELAEGLASYVSATRRISKSCGSALRALTAISVALTAEDETGSNGLSNMRIIRERYLSLLPLVGEHRFIQDTVAYSELCNLFGSLGLQDLQVVSSILRSMNATDSSKLDSPDLDERIEGLNVIVKSFKCALANLDKASDPEKHVVLPYLEDGEESKLIQCGKDSVMAMVYGCIAAIKFDDVAVRGTSSYALQLIAKWVAVSKSHPAVTCQSKLFFLLLDSFVSAKTQILRREYCRGFSELLRNCTLLEIDDGAPARHMFPLLKALCESEDRESEFYENIVHMQAHRRGRALRRLEKEFLRDKEGRTLDASDCDARAVLASRFAFPLGFNVALESGAVGEKDHRYSSHNEAKDNAQRDVMIWAVSLVGACAQQMSWPVYKLKIAGLMRRMQNKTADTQDDVLYKLLVKIAEAFPRKKNPEDDEESSKQQFLTTHLLPGLLAFVSRGGIEGEIIERTNGISGLATRARRKAPPTVFRANLAIAAGHLLKLLPESEVDRLISLLITPLANALRSRMNATRESAKKALTSVILILGFKYLSYILCQILGALRQGHRKDACVYVIHAILLGIKDSNMKAAPGGQSTFTVDAAADTMSSYLANELESGNAVLSNDFEDPNATSVRQKQAAARASRALECYEILAEYINFEKSARVIIQPLASLLKCCSSAKLSSKIENALQKMVIGFSRNNSVVLPYAFKLCYCFLSSSSEVREPLPDDAAKSSSKLTEGRSLSIDAQSDYRLTKFGFLLLSATITKNREAICSDSSSSKQLRAMLEPFLPITAEILSTRHDSLKVTAFKFAQKLLRFPLTNKEAVAMNLSEVIINVLSQNGGTLTHNDDLFNCCLRAAAVLLHEIGEHKFEAVPRERVETLLSVASNCIESGAVEARTAAMGLLRAIVTSGITIPAVYDAMEKVNKLAIRAHSSTLRAACASLSIAFMISFPMGSRRIRQQLEFFVRNLNYRLSSGRLAAIEALKLIISKFPAELIESECEYFFVALAACAGRDADTKCRWSAIQAVQELFERMPPGRKIVDMLRMAFVFLGVESSTKAIDEEVKVVTRNDKDVALSGAFAMSAACKSGRLSLAQLGLVCRALVGALQDQAGEEDGLWEVTYGLLQGIEQALDAQEESTGGGRLEKQRFMADLWNMMPKLLVHKHQWVRLSSARLLGKHLSASGGRDARMDGLKRNQYSVLWDGSDLVRRLLRSCCLQLEANFLSEDLGQQCLKNVLCIGDVLFKNPLIGDVHEDSVTVRAVDDGSLEKEPNRGLKWLISRISGMASRVAENPHEMLRVACALRFLLVSSNWWGLDFVKPNAEAYVAPNVRILEAPVTPPAGSKAVDHGLDGDVLRELASRLQDALIETIGATKYFEVYQAIREKKESKKNLRKRQAAFEQAINPELAAKKRRKRSSMKKRRKSKRQGRISEVEDDIDAIRRARDELTADL